MTACPRGMLPCTLCSLGGSMLTSEEGAIPNPKRGSQCCLSRLLDMHPPTLGMRILSCLHLPPRFLSKAPQLSCTPSLLYLLPVCRRKQKNIGFLHHGGISRALRAWLWIVTQRKRGRKTVVFSHTIKGLAQWTVLLQNSVFHSRNFVYVLLLQHG